MSQAVLTPHAGSPHDEHLHLGRNWWLFLLLGLVSVFVGLVAIGSAFIATLATVTVLGILLLIAGGAEVIHAIAVRNLRGFALHLLGAALYLLVGLFMLEDPVKAAGVLTLLISAGFFVAGVLRIIFSLAVQFHSWGWVLVNGIVDVCLGVMIMRHWPSSSLWVIGMFIGIDLVFQGWAWIFLALTARSISARTNAA